MIEFKADCGHTIRARDEDAGSVVRCSYCGRNAQVPDSRDSELDFLFRDLDEGGEIIPEKRRKRRVKQRKGAAKRPTGSFDPFAVILKLCYAALLIAIVIVVGRKWVLPLFEMPESVHLARNVAGRDANADPARRDNPSSRRRGTGPGLIKLRRPDGLHVTSTPTGAAGYCIEEDKAPQRGRRIFDVPGVQQFTTDGECPRTSDGGYIVELAFPWNNPRFKDYYQGYTGFRRAIEGASDDQRRSLVEEYFMPDDAIDAFVFETEEQKYLIRQYQAVVRHGRSKGVQALFLPRIQQGDDQTMAIEPLVSSILPTERAYQFNEEHVRSELAYYGVPEADRRYVVEALARIGAITYVTPDGRARLFKIGMHDGVFATKVVRENPG